MAKKPEGTFLTSCGAGTCSPAPVFYRAAVREKNVAALTIFRAPSPNAHTNVAALIERHAGRQVTEGLDDRVMPPNLSLRGGRRPTWRPEREARGSALGVQSREGSHDFAGSALLSTPVLRDCHVASLLAMTRQGGARRTSALMRLNSPIQGGHYP